MAPKIAKALLTKLGFLTPARRIAYGTATEHATSAFQSGSTATEHATSHGSTATEHPTEVESHDSSTEDGSHDMYDEGFTFEDDDLDKILALLLWMSQDFQKDIPMQDIHHAAVEVVTKQSEWVDGWRVGDQPRESVVKLSKLIDIMMLTKKGELKDANETLHFMRRVAAMRWQLLGTANDNATERVELDEAAVSSCYQRFGRDLLTNDLLPHQKTGKDAAKYRLREYSQQDTSLTNPQRSFTDQMLRKNLGAKQVAFRIWQKGLPSIAVAGHNVVVVSGSGTRSEVRGPALDMGMLQSSLDECLRWYISLANDIVVHQTQEGFDAQLSSSSKDEQDRQQQQQRREQLQKAQDALRLGATLAKERDAGKRTFFEMNAIEQPILEDYDSGRAKKRCIALQLTELKPFRSQQ